MSAMAVRVVEGQEMLDSAGLAAAADRMAPQVRPILVALDKVRRSGQISASSVKCCLLRVSGALLPPDHIKVVAEVAAFSSMDLDSWAAMRLDSIN